MNFTHLNEEQRYQIEARLARGQSKSVIALALGVHVSTIYRERQRGLRGGYYRADAAHAAALRRRAISAANHPVKPSALWQLARQCLQADWSPQQIEGRLALVGAADRISAQGVYDWLARRTSNGLRAHLRHHRDPAPWRASGGGLPKKRPRIRQRPKAAHLRTQPGHWEGDTILGATRHHCLVTLVERLSLYTRLSKPLPKCADAVADAIRRRLANLPAESLTLDNGTEFAAFATMGVPVFFADPGKPRQRARNENTNGLIRQYVSRTTRLTSLSANQIQRIEDRLNHRPRKSLGYLTPYEVLFQSPPAPFAIRD